MSARPGRRCTRSRPILDASSSSALPLAPAHRTGVRENLDQILLLILLNAFVGATIGIERAVLVPLGTSPAFGLAKATAVTSFIVAFGVTKAFTNLFAGRLADALGRRRVLLIGWAFGLPVPLLILWAPSWGWVVIANLFLGVNQGLCWTLVLFMKLDLGGPKRRGFSAGINETIGYGAVALTAAAGTEIAHAYGLRPRPLYFAFAITVLGCALALLFIRETRLHVEQEHRDQTQGEARPGFGALFARVSILDLSLLGRVQAGFARNLADGMAWGLLILLFTRTVGGRGAGTLQWLMIGSFALPQVLVGWWSDGGDRKPYGVAGMALIAASLAWIASTSGFVPWTAGVIALGLGGALMYPTVIAGLSDAMAPIWRASGLGVYRFWRDLGYAAGALGAGMIADAFRMRAAVYGVAGMCLLSSLAAAALIPRR
ncbi:MAG: MFS transporter [Myxococcales bacterium]|nr:MFS transporter [Myxococcales bacterium]